MCGCGQVGNAPALFKRSVMSTVEPSMQPVVPSRQTTIGVRWWSTW
jgi:hypothetical protein